MKFSGKLWSDHGTTGLYFWSIPRNHTMPQCATRGGVCCAFAPQLVVYVRGIVIFSISVSVSSRSHRRRAVVVLVL